MKNIILENKKLRKENEELKKEIMSLNGQLTNCLDRISILNKKNYELEGKSQMVKDKNAMMKIIEDRLKYEFTGQYCDISKESLDLQIIGIKENIESNLKEIIDKYYVDKQKVKDVIEKYFMEYEKEKEYRFTDDVEAEQEILIDIEKEILEG